MKAHVSGKAGTAGNAAPPDGLARSNGKQRLNKTEETDSRLGLNL
jgi:hypothetical protein